MLDSNKILEEYINFRIENLSFWERAQGCKPHAQLSKDLVPLSQLITKGLPPFKRLRPPIINTVSSVIVLLMLIGVWIYALWSICEGGKNSIWLFIFILPIIIAHIFKQSFLNKALLFSIFMDGKGLSVKDHTFAWDDIAAVAFMSVKIDPSYHLLLVLKGGTLKKYDLCLFSNDIEDLALYIESYRAATGMS